MSSEVYINRDTLSNALRALYATADSFLKIWFVLKHMGLATGAPPVVIDTASPTPSLKRLFSFGHPEGEFFVPFAHTSRYLTMKRDAARSIVQTNIQRWNSSQSVVTCDPTGYLDIRDGAEGKLLVSPSRSYPMGLGSGKNGFALKDDQRVTLPAIAFAAWYGRQTPIPVAEKPANYLLKVMREELCIEEAEYACLFVDKPLVVSTTEQKLSDVDIYDVCQALLKAPSAPETLVITETFQTHAARVKSMASLDDRPVWLRYSPEKMLLDLIESGAKAILLYGAPRTGKTRAIDLLKARADPQRETIQIHDGWSYEHLIQGQQPDESGSFSWQSGMLKKAVEKGKKIIVLEEINRTLISQSLGEVFSLIEDSYRGEKNSITLRNGESFFIPEDVLFLMTMNTIDRSTEDIDDALLGRFAAIEFSPRVEDLTVMLRNLEIPEEKARKIRALYAEILDVYPLGHGYFSQVKETTDLITYYITKIRPVLVNHLAGLRSNDLSQVDNLVNTLFGN